MGIIQMLIPIVGADGYIISRALRFNSGDSSYLSKTYTSTGNRRTWTWSAWIKRTGNNNGGLFGKYYSNNTFGTLFFNSDQLQFSANTTWFKTTQVFRDFSSFFHVVLAVDTTLAAAGDRIRLYINGAEVTSFATENNPSQNSDLGPDNTTDIHIGRDGSNYFNGLMADIQFVDGQALAASEFGKYNSAGVWIPKKYDGAFGNNGFRLNFDKVDSTQKLGYDVTQEVTLNPKAGMDIVTYSGNGGTQHIGGLSFEPGLTWIKNRNGAHNHMLYDSVRGPGLDLMPNGTQAQNQGGSNDLTSFNLNGFSLGSNNAVNQSSRTYVAWNWRAGGPAVSNSDGSVTSQVSANNDYGFSIVKYTMGSSDITVGHGLSTEPKWIITKRYDNTDSWIVYHASLGKTKYLFLNGTNAAFTDTADAFTSTSSSVFDARAGLINAGECIAYCWSEVSGFSKFGSWTGSGSASGNIVTTGFKPRFLMWKRTDTADNWAMVDSKRSGSNPMNDWLGSFSSDAESVNNSAYAVDFLDNGFELKATHVATNASGGNYVYMCFADRPGNNWDVNNIVTNEGLTASKQNFDVMLYTGNSGNLAVGQPVYSDQTTGGNNTSNMFDGSSSSWNNLTAGNTITFTPSPAIACTQLDIWVDTGTPIRVNVNGGGYGSTFTQSGLGYVNITPGGGMTSLTSLLIDAPSGGGGTGAGIRGLRINGTTIVVDGNGGPGLKFQPDLVWLKSRSHTYDHYLTDSVRGATKSLRSNTTAAEVTLAQGLTAFNSDGFSLGNEGQFNNTGRTYVAWCWKAGGTAVSNSDGSIASSVSANAAYGFSIIKFTTASNTSGGATVGHGLGAQPGMYMYKPTSTTGEWVVVSSHDYDQFAYLNANTQFRSISSQGGGTPADPTNSVLSLYDLGVALASKTYICYAFANVPGYQRIGSYTGNGSSTGPLVVTGFKPKFLLIKGNNTSGWVMYDSERDSVNPNNFRLQANSSGAESTGDANTNIDFLDNGFQLKNGDSDSNGSGVTYAYLAIADDEIGSDEDVLLDVPAAVTADADETDTTGGYQRGNYAVLNPLDSGSGVTLSNGNLDFSSSGSSQAVREARGNIAMPAAGKYFFEVTVGTVGELNIGLENQANGNLSVYYRYNSNNFNNIYIDGSNNNRVDSYTDNDVIGVAYNSDDQKIRWYKNGKAVGSEYSLTNNGQLFPHVSHGSSSGSATGKVNFGQMRFKYGLPSGYAALNTTALPAATIADGSAYFATVLYTGNQTARSITTGHASDFVWLKVRNQANNHFLFDSVRGIGRRLMTSGTNAEDGNSSTDTVTSFNSDGFSLGADTATGGVNANSASMVGWSWNAGANSNKTYTVKVVSDSGNKYRFDDFGTSAVTLDLAEGSTYVFDQSDSSNAGHPLRFSTTANGTHGGGTEYTTGVTVTGTPGQAGAKTTIVVAASAPTLFYYCTQHSGMGGQANTNSTAGASNFDGSIQTTVKASPEAGFSIVTYTGSSSGSTVGHGLNAAPEFIIGKRRNGTSEWSCYHKSLGNNQAIILNTNAAAGSSSTWNNTTPSSSVVTLGSAHSVNFSSYTHVLYCFAPVAGYSAFGGPYTGTGTTSGPFQYCGFRPRWIMIKSSVNGATNNGNDWTIFDTTRAPYNETDAFLEANTTSAESTGGNDQIDILSNGFKPRQGNTQTNHQSNQYIWIAFAEHPFQANNGLAR